MKSHRFQKKTTKYISNTDNKKNNTILRKRVEDLDTSPEVIMNEFPLRSRFSRRK